MKRDTVVDSDDSEDFIALHCTSYNKFGIVKLTKQVFIVPGKGCLKQLSPDLKWINCIRYTCLGRLCLKSDPFVICAGIRNNLGNFMGTVRENLYFYGNFL